MKQTRNLYCVLAAATVLVMAFVVGYTVPHACPPAPASGIGATYDLMAASTADWRYYSLSKQVLADGFYVTEPEVEVETLATLQPNEQSVSKWHGIVWVRKTHSNERRVEDTDYRKTLNGLILFGDPVVLAKIQAILKQH